MCYSILELKSNQRLGHKKTKLNTCHVVHTTAKPDISRRRKNENVFKMSKDEKCTCKACKNTVFHCQICKFRGFLLPSSFWLLKLHIFANTDRIGPGLFLQNRKMDCFTVSCKVFLVSISALSCSDVLERWFGFDTDNKSESTALLSFLVTIDFKLPSFSRLIT